MPRLMCLLCLSVTRQPPARIPSLRTLASTGTVGPDRTGSSSFPPPPTFPNPRPITVGEEVRARFEGNELDFDLIATRDGTLEATVAWDVILNGSLLVLVLQDTEVKPVPPYWSPVSGKLRVVAGRTYRLRIRAGGTDWFYGDPFVLTTKID